MGGIFHKPAVRGPRRQQMLAAVAARHPDHFPSPESVAAWMNLVFVPASGRWSYVRNGKAGTTSTLRFLFELEFGVPLTVRAVLPNDVNPDAPPHQLGNADVFRPLAGFAAGLDRIESALRLATVRHPVERALSAFRYLCMTQEKSHPWFLRERLRMNASVGFDWSADPGTPRGFEKFLHHLELTLSETGPSAVNTHWRPQVDIVLPDVYRPVLVGKVEDLAGFFREIAARLGQPLAEDWQPPRANVAGAGAGGETLLTPAALARIEHLYARDFEAFGYVPERRAA